jgi:hypothetical protein
LKKPILVTTALIIIGGGIALAARQPSNNRDWITSQERLPAASINDSTVTIRDVRNFDYDTLGNNIARRYDDRTYDLSKLQSVWFVLAPFDPENRGPAHSFLSFGFADSQFVAISVEARREADEQYSIVKGMLRKYEIMYVVGDERDLIRLRVANGDDVYLYPIRTSPEKVRALFVRMLERGNDLRADPQFYNTLTNNCTTNILDHVNSIAPKKIPYGREVLLPGYADELAVELGLIDSELPIAEVRRRFHINDRARRAFHDANFSVAIRKFE